MEFQLFQPLTQDHGQTQTINNAQNVPKSLALDER